MPCVFLLQGHPDSLSHSFSPEMHCTKQHSKQDISSLMLSKKHAKAQRGPGPQWRVHSQRGS